MSQEGLHLVGLLRSEQGNLMTLVGGLLAIILVLYAFKRIAPQAYARTKPVPSNIGTLLGTFALIFYVWHIVNVVADNRLPRQDVNRTSVYQQMESNVNR